MCTCVSVCWSVHTGAGACGGQKKASYLPRAAVTGSLRHSMWVLGTSLRSYARVVRVLNSEHLSGSEHLFFSHCSKVAEILVPPAARCWPGLQAVGYGATMPGSDLPMLSSV